MRGARWTTAEDNILIAHYRQYRCWSSPPIIPKRTAWAVIHRAREIGLANGTTKVLWTTKEERVLAEHYKEGVDVCTKLLPCRSWNSICIRAAKLGLTSPRPRISPTHRKGVWQAAEDEILTRFVHDINETVKQLAIAGYARTITAILRRRCKLKLRLTPADGYTSAEIAKLLGCNQTAIYKWEKYGLLEEFGYKEVSY